jgi:hypothetical protein
MVSHENTNLLWISSNDFMPVEQDLLRATILDPLQWINAFSGIHLRNYQVGPLLAITRSVLERRGGSFVIIFPRQSGKNELQAQIEFYLLTILNAMDTELVKASPTWKPQSLNAMRRLERVLDGSIVTRDVWTKESGYVIRLNKARIYFLSGSETANVVGATANVLLQCDEAQDVSRYKWDKDFAPMAASTNATTVFWGTAWTSKTLLARERKNAEKLQAKDGIQRVWIMDAESVAAEVPAYGDYVAAQIEKLGRNHPLVKTQFFCEEIDAEGGMFPAARLAKMKGDHLALEGPQPGQRYAMTIDVAGEDEGAVGEDPAVLLRAAESLSRLENPARDATAVTIFNLDTSTLPADEQGAPTYRVVARYRWIGTKHTQIYNQLKEIARLWRAEYIVIDSTGVGAGLASFLEASFPGRVIPFLFTSKSKSDLGWQFLAVIETGRYKEPLGGMSASRSKCGTGFWEQARSCMNQVLEGPGRIMRWGVPDGTRNDLGELVHDDELISAALCAVLDDQDIGIASAPIVLHRDDPLQEMDEEGF